jgi:hypothetical protein
MICFCVRCYGLGEHSCYFSGAIDELQVYTRSLSHAEILNRYQFQNPYPYTEFLVAFFPFDYTLEDRSMQPAGTTSKPTAQWYSFQAESNVLHPVSPMFWNVNAKCLAYNDRDSFASQDSVQSLFGPGASYRGGHYRVFKPSGNTVTLLSSTLTLDKRYKLYFALAGRIRDA